MQEMGRNTKCLGGQPEFLSDTSPVAGLVCLDPKWPMHHAEAPTHLQGCDREGHSGRVAFSPAGTDADDIYQVPRQTPACHG